MHFISFGFLGIPASFLIFLAEGSQDIFQSCRGLIPRFHEEGLAVFLIGDLAILIGMTNFGLGLGMILGRLAG